MQIMKFFIKQPPLRHFLLSFLGQNIFSRNLRLLFLKSIKTCVPPIASGPVVSLPVLLTILSVAESTKQIRCVSLGRHVELHVRALCKQFLTARFPGFRRASRRRIRKAVENYRSRHYAVQNPHIFLTTNAIFAR
jgi:hypothetical protein